MVTVLGSIDEQAALDALDADDDFKALDEQLRQFNIFEALGIVRQELWHSSLLAYLLDPSESHRLGDAFIKRLLLRALERAGSSALASGLTSDTMAQWDLTAGYTQREWRNIDILFLQDKPYQLAVIVENKIDSSEHSRQLERYRKIVAAEHKGWRIVPIYLTPTGARPSDRQYLPLSYDDIRAALEELIGSAGPDIDPSVRTLVGHYAQLLRRHIVPDQSIEELCQSIYRRHRRAIDLIIEHRPDRQADLRSIIEDLISSAGGSLRLNHARKLWIEFSTPVLDDARLRVDENWNPSHRMLMFWFRNEPSGVELLLYIHPGPPELRERLHAMAIAQHAVFGPVSKLKKGWVPIYRRQYLSQQDLDVLSTEALEAKVHQQWASFMATDLPAINASVAQEVAAWPTIQATSTQPDATEDFSSTSEPASDDDWTEPTG